MRMAPGLRRYLLMGVALLAVLVGWRWGSAFVGEILPTKETKEPILVMPLVLASRDIQTGTFRVNNYGRYRLGVYLRLKDGPQGYQKDRRALMGLVEIQDQAGQPRLLRRIEKSFLGHEVGGVLFDFDAPEVGGEGPKTISLQLSIEPEFIDHYSGVTLLIRRQPRWPLVD